MGQEPISGPISLGEAMAHALKYNLELRVGEDQIRLANAKLDLSHYSLLPDAVVESGYVRRNNDNASTSLDLLSGRRDRSASTSQDRQQRSGDISISWDILDFGLSYIQAQQSADDVLIAREQWRSTLHKLIEDVRVEYWRASTYQRLVERLQKLSARTDAAIANSRKLSNGTQINRLSVLSSEREMLKVKQAIKDLEQDLINAKAELARLMNLHPDTPFTLDAERPSDEPFKLNMPLDEILELAVSRRPELRQNWYEQRINVKEAQANVLELLPSLRGYATLSQNSNSFLLNSGWTTAGAALSWSLIKSFQYPAKRNATNVRQEVLDRQALALTMTVVTQVYLSLIRYDYQSEKVSLAENYLSVQKRLTQQMRIEARASLVSEQELILEEMNELIAEAKYDIALADMQKAYGGLISSVGLEASPSVDPKSDIATLAGVLEEEWSMALETRTTLHPASGQ